MEGSRMFGAIWMLSIRLRTFLRRFMPTNVVIAAIFTRRGLRWGMFTLLLAVGYLFAAVLSASLIEQGAPGWVNLLVLLFLWNALKFLVVAPASLVCLALVRYREAQVWRMSQMPVMSDGVALERVTRAPARVMH
jgi:hypothetical protein